MSATMETGPLLEYLKHPDLMTMPAFVEVQKKMHDIKELYIDSVCGFSPVSASLFVARVLVTFHVSWISIHFRPFFLKKKNFQFDRPYCADNLMDAVLYHIDQLDTTELWEFFFTPLYSLFSRIWFYLFFVNPESIFPLSGKPEKGTVLVFLPGKRITLMTNHSINQSIDQSLNQSINQSIEKSINQ